MNISILSKQALLKALNVRDLSNPEEGDHAIQILIEKIRLALEKAWDCKSHIYRESPIVSVEDNYDRLRYPADGPARAARYTRYVCDNALLRTSTSAMIPKAMRKLAHELQGEDLILCPGLVYRRDQIDRLHLAEIHQMDLWRITKKPMNSEDMREMIQLVLDAVLEGCEYRLEERVHPYTQEGLQIDVQYEGEWVEVGECGLTHPEIHKENLPQGDPIYGLAMGLGLDRILMLRKGMKDVRLIASHNPRISKQMKDLEPYKEVSYMPAVRRDLSLVLDIETDVETLGDKVRESLGDEAYLIESLEILNEHPYSKLPPHVQEKLGMEKGQKNALVRVVLRSLHRSLTDEECNLYRDKVYKCLHKGKYWEWASNED
ncbi:MAG: hypothetical protein AAGD28_13855 [Bacteroidota bacterium]